MKTCLFDIDGTLVLTGGAGMVAFAQTFAEVFGVPEITKSVSFSGRSDRAIASDLMAAHGVPVTEDNWQEFRQGYAARLPAALEACQGCVLPGVERLLTRLQERGDVLIGLLTGNLRQTAQMKLAHYGLWRHFDFGGFGDIHLCRNEIAAAALAEAELQHGQDGAGGEHLVVVIGDTEHDVTCAHSIGARSVATPTGVTPVETLRAAGPHLLVETLEDSAAILQWFDE
ncbi:MAG: HAD family hydrolase [Planctomycetales bacterium]|nr:HAD family hydrolase [Planctomycetales bacterium]